MQEEINQDNNKVYPDQIPNNTENIDQQTKRQLIEQETDNLSANSNEEINQ